MKSLFMTFRYFVLILRWVSTYFILNFKYLNIFKFVLFFPSTELHFEFILIEFGMKGNLNPSGIHPTGQVRFYLFYSMNPFEHVGFSFSLISWILLSMLGSLSFLFHESFWTCCVLSLSYSMNPFEHVVFYLSLIS